MTNKTTRKTVKDKQTSTKLNEEKYTTKIKQREN
jgi:hypothetical protein